MHRLPRLAPAAAFALALLTAAGAQAQALNQWCENLARRSCGDEARNLSLADCMSEYDIWPSIPNECVGEIQTMIEMEREARAEPRGRDLGAWCENLARRSCGDEARNFPLADCMSEYDQWPSVPNECVAELQTLIENEREATSQVPTRRQATSNLLGYSYGGVLRAGPGTEYRKVASLRPSDWLEIVEETGVWFDGYQWFRVETGTGSGYHWGGIFCTEGGVAVDGVFGSCN